MRPAYFGSSARPLFGIHELPRSASSHGGAVLLCYPGVQEYNMAHWAFRRLSAMLAREGFHVMRFDWSGTGDSWGETTDGTLERWLDDVSQAAQELRDSSGAESLSIVGMRLGAAIAGLACGEARVADDLVFWDPVVVGELYIRELEAYDAKENLRLLHDPPPVRDELVGFPFPAALRASVGAIDLRKQPPKTARRVAIVGTATKSDHGELRDALRAAGVEVTYDCVPEEQSTASGVQNDAALLPTRTLAAITDRVLGRVPS
jgi:pimeloyl-ACP methyl ester carboxylesterase